MRAGPGEQQAAPASAGPSSASRRAAPDRSVRPVPLRGVAAPTASATPSPRERTHDGQGRHQRLRTHRPQRPARHQGSRPHRHRGRGHQRSRPGRDQRPPAALRLGPRQVPRHRLGRRRPHRGRRAAHPRHRDQESGRAAPPRARRRHRDGMHRHLHLEGQGEAPPRCRRQARPRLGSRGRRRPHGRLRRQPRQADGRPPGGLQRFLHHQLPGSGRQGAQRRRRHRARLHDHDPLLHQRPAVAGPDAQGPLPGPRRIPCR